VAAHPDATLEELQVWLAAEHEIQVSIVACGTGSNFSACRLKKVGTSR
jgi:hypothetical protein